MQSDVITSPPSLVHLCRECVAKHQYWRVMKRHLEALDEHDINAVVNLLITNHRLPPWSLPTNFRHTSLSSIDATITKPGPWIACASCIPTLKRLSFLVSDRTDRGTDRTNTSHRPVPISPMHCRRLSLLAPALTDLSLVGMHLHYHTLDTSVLPHLTNLTRLVLRNHYRHNTVPKDVKLSVEHALMPLRNLKVLELAPFYDLGPPPSLSSLARSLPNLRSLTLFISTIEHGDYAPGILSLGTLPHLSFFSFTGPSTCPPACPTLTSLYWAPTHNDDMHPEAQLAWMYTGITPSLPRLKRVTIQAQEATSMPEVYDILLPLLHASSNSLTTLTLMRRDTTAWPGLAKLCEAGRRLREVRVDGVVAVCDDDALGRWPDDDAFDVLVQQYMDISTREENEEKREEVDNSGGIGGVVNLPLLTHDELKVDERYRYTTEELLALQNNDKDGELGSVQILSTIVEELRIGDVSQGG